MSTHSRTGPTAYIPTITLNNDKVPLIPSYSASSDAYVDIPDSIPLLDLNPLWANPTPWAATIEARTPAQAQATHTDTQAQAQTQHKQLAPFRAIIVGGGTHGLILAHMLHQAGIDYTLLERSPTITTTDDDHTPYRLCSRSARILDQLGLQPAARERSTPICTTHTQHQQRMGGVLRRSSRSHGGQHPWMLLLDRAGLLRLLWEALPGREVVSVETHAAGVRVVCADGAAEEGSVVIGCDGVHGVVRQAMSRLRAAGKGGRERRRPVGGLSLVGLGGKGDEAAGPVTARYYGLVGWIPLLDGLEPGACYETRSRPEGKMFQILTGEDMAYFPVYIRLDKPTCEQARYTDQDAKQLASELAEHPVTGKIKFGDLWRARRWGKMVDIHKGLTNKWYHDRAVLVGGAAHKLTPRAGFGIQTGWLDAVGLTNMLRRRLVMTRGESPDTASIKRAFEEYQNSRRGPVRRAMLFTAVYTRAAANQRLLFRLCDWVTSGVTLDFVEEQHHGQGKVKGAGPPSRPNAASAEEAEKRKGHVVWVYPGIPITVN